MLESALHLTARSALEAPLRSRDLVGSCLGATVLQTPSRARRATSPPAPTDKVFPSALLSARSTRQCCHSFAGAHRFPWTFPFTVQVGESVPDIKVSPPVPATLGSRNCTTSCRSFISATPEGMPS